MHTNPTPTTPTTPTPAAPLPPGGGAPPPIDTRALPNDPDVLKQMIAELLRELRRERRDREALQRRLDALLRHLHQPRPPVTPPNQPLLFDDLNEAPEPPPLATTDPDDKPSRRGKCRKHGRQIPPPELRRETKRHELTEAERCCPDCGCEREEIGSERSLQYDYRPAEVFIVEHERVKYACPACEGHVVVAPKPPQPIERGEAGAGLLAAIVVDKYQDHLPLYRTEARLARLGSPLRRSTMCDWMAGVAELLQPLYELLTKWVLQSKKLHTDDTTVPVRDESLSTNRYGRLWVYIGDDGHPGIVFDYTATHARDGPVAFLKNFQGYLQADAYGGYDGIYTGSDGKIIEVACWAHARNKSKDAQTTDPERALAVKAWVRALYAVEDEAKAEIARLQLSGAAAAAVRLRLRQEKSVPLLRKFREWLLVQKEQLLPKSPLAGAVTYILNQWEALNRYTTDGDLDIDNNLSERILKLIGIGRNNWLFVGSDAGGKTAAVLFSFTATCKHLGLNTFKYLREVFELLPALLELGAGADVLEELLPHRWQAARTAAQAEAGSAPAASAAGSSVGIVGLLGESSADAVERVSAGESATSIVVKDGGSPGGGSGSGVRWPELPPEPEVVPTVVVPVNAGPVDTGIRVPVMRVTLAELEELQKQDAEDRKKNADMYRKD